MNDPRLHGPDFLGFGPNCTVDLQPTNGNRYDRNAKDCVFERFGCTVWRQRTVSGRGAERNRAIRTNNIYLLKVARFLLYLM